MQKYSIVITAGIVAVIAISLVLYLMWFSSPLEITENVTVIAVTESGCIAETMDGFSINIGQCNAEPGDSVIATYDIKVKERLSAVLP